MKKINLFLDEEQYDELMKIKGDRTWVELVMMLPSLMKK